MNRFETHESKGHLDGDCFGFWDMSDPACTMGKCMAAGECEAKTKRGAIKQEDTGKVQEVVLTEEDRKLPDIPPMEYMLELLRGRFEYTTKSNDKAIAHCFLKDEQPVFTIIISKANGKVKLQSPLCASKVLDDIASIEQVEEIVKEMVG